MDSFYRSRLNARPPYRTLSGSS
ncbi:protein of unknown function [Methylocella tundrae]|uniref:Uncharacterized protein n=1 Tax=Methylocella tundrae TaxID=227605 RepID=A0A4V6YUH9_METTU|nr:protein of unknown function [Methylocella tundrae]